MKIPRRHPFTYRHLRTRRALAFLVQILLYCMPFSFLRMQLFLFLQDRQTRGLLYYLAYPEFLRLSTANDIKNYLFGSGGSPDRHSSGSGKEQRYLLYFPFIPMAGLDHCLRNLRCLLLEAHFLGRVPVILHPIFNPFHNYDIWRNYRWEDYIDLASVRAKERDADNADQSIELISYDKFLSQPIAKEDILVLRKPADITPEQNKKYSLVIRSTDSVSNHWNELFPSYAIAHEKYHIMMPYSKKAERIASTVLDRIEKPFITMHLRRKDTLFDWHRQVFAEGTSVENVLHALRSSDLPNTLPVYIMTDEKDRSFYSPLKKYYKTYQFFDFLELERLVSAADGEQNVDNHLLYQVEKIIFKAAKYRFHSRKEYRTNMDKFLEEINFDLPHEKEEEREGKGYDYSLL